MIARARTLIPAVLFLLFGTDTSTEITFTTDDGVTIYGDVFESSAGKSAPTVLLFHQGASNARAEYATIIPVLTAEGYNVIAVDQRRGGSRLGGTNRTVDALVDAEYEYCDAYPDLEATLDYALENGFAGPIVAWGSSYSAALSIYLAHRNPDHIDAVLAFSPASGGPMAACNPNDLAAELKTPLLLLRPASETEIESVRQQLSLFEDAGHKTYVAANGVHGSSMLNPDRIEDDPAATWQVVLEFLHHAASPMQDQNNE